MFIGLFIITDYNFLANDLLFIINVNDILFEIFLWGFLLENQLWSLDEETGLSLSGCLMTGDQLSGGMQLKDLLKLHSDLLSCEISVVSYLTTKRHFFSWGDEMLAATLICHVKNCRSLSVEQKIHKLNVLDMFLIPEDCAISFKDILCQELRRQ